MYLLEIAIIAGVSYIGDPVHSAKSHHQCLGYGTSGDFVIKLVLKVFEGVLDEHLDLFPVLGSFFQCFFEAGEEFTFLQRFQGAILFQNL